VNNQDILKNAPEGATHVDDVSEYWILTDSPKNTSMAWIKGKGWRPMLDINGYFFRSLDDMRKIEELKSNIDSGADRFVLWAKANKAVDCKSALFIHALKVAYDRRKL
jgi:hypothetical protein